MKTLVVGGSHNEEHSYGLQSARRVQEALARRGWDADFVDCRDLSRLQTMMADGNYDSVTPIGFGPISPEDGTIWTLAKANFLNCAGPNPSAGSLCTNKTVLSTFIRGQFYLEDDINVPGEVAVGDGAVVETVIDQIDRLKLQAPFMVKPNSGGSSVGLHVAGTCAEAVDLAMADRKNFGVMLIQEFVTPCDEFTLTTLDDALRTDVLPIIQLDKTGVEVMGAEEKFGASGNERHIVEPSINERLRQRLNYVALTLHDVIGARGVQRVDVLVKANNDIYIIDINPIAGLLAESLAVDAARAAGLSFDDLAERYALTAFRTGPDEPAPVNRPKLRSAGKGHQEANAS